MGDGKDEGFWELPQRGFMPAIEALPGFNRSVLEAYGLRCAISGERFLAEPAQPHPHLEVVAIRPLALGGAVSIGNCLALEQQIARHFRRGIIQIDEDFRVVVAEPAALEPAIRPHVIAGRVLFLPALPEHWPGLASLAFHRRLFARDAR